jgi:hypothetical protein
MRALLFVDDAAWCSDFNHARRPDDFTYDLAGSEDEVKRLLEAKAFDVIITRRGPRELAFTRFQRLLAKVAPACPLYLLEDGDVEGATCVGALTPQGLVDLLASEFELAPRTSPLDGYEVTRLLADRGSWYLHAARSLASGEHGVLSTFDFSFEDDVDALTDVLAHPPAANVVELDADHPRIFWALGEGRTVRELGVVSTEVALAVLEQLTASLAALHGAEQVHGWFNPAGTSPSSRRCRSRWRSPSPSACVASAARSKSTDARLVEAEPLPAAARVHCAVTQSDHSAPARSSASRARTRYHPAASTFHVAG